ncbi:MAG TPA: DUF929 family protein [Dermatophilaceae bacterium]|uniref:DUF929 family protein n=1 Tax=Candidatus Phosphoribacter hodrii TaxID=2953743 RepID=A0A935CED2_9MICO|nr:DUF929 family protein [Candidatus Phosphoribacter hodrii]MBP8838245.1 DUF929 family protein [Dermatophilaceae bacterium]HNV13570.1 DUF929 family protein [Dermatophilaceae bacterium]HOA01848.1 DUF929 family protein [Dermatophilaceae bacterium]HOA57538.1 DUF929 family protein [Dermatophilaceae bacterium]
MGKSARAQNARLVELRAQQAKAERRSKLMIAGATVGVVAIVVIALVIAALQGGTDVTGQSSTALDQATFAKVTSVPAASLDTVGAGASDNPPKTIDAPALTKDGKPRVLYVGAEYCPYCATERWPLVVALSRFGTWNNLSASFSAPAPEVNPNTATVSFHGATYSSQYVSFTGYETSTNKQTNGQWGKLDTLEGEDLALFQKFNAPPYVQSSGAIPWINLGGTSIQAGASYNSAVILNKTQAEIATALADPTTDIAKGVNGAANVLTAQICKSTNQQPTAVCTAPGVVAAAAKLQ